MMLPGTVCSYIVSFYVTFWSKQLATLLFQALQPHLNILETDENLHKILREIQAFDWRSILKFTEGTASLPTLIPLFWTQDFKIKISHFHVWTLAACVQCVHIYLLVPNSCQTRGYLTVGRDPCLGCNVHECSYGVWHSWFLTSQYEQSIRCDDSKSKQWLVFMTYFEDYEWFVFKIACSLFAAHIKTALCHMQDYFLYIVVSGLTLLCISHCQCLSFK